MSSVDTEKPSERSWRQRLPLHGPAMVLVPAVAAVAVLLIVVIVMGLVPKKLPAVAVPPRPVEVLTIAPVATLPDVFELPGVVEPRRVVRVSAEVAGRVERIDVVKGQTVRTGGTMISLNTDLLLAACQRARAAAEFDAKDLERISELHRRNVATASELDQARAKAEASQATLNEAQAELNRAVIVAPLDGVANLIPVEVGEYVQKGTQVAEVVEIDTVKVVTGVPSRDVAYLKVGTPQRIVLNPSGEEVTGEITYVGAVADEATRTTPVEITADNRQRTFHSGHNVTVRLKRQDLTDVILIPLEAVTSLQDGKEVYVVENGQAARRRVTLGIFSGRQVQVTSGLAAGDRLIVGGSQRYVGPGQPVTVVEQPATQPSP